eukprot:TRINITY_DN1543_c0_g1_i15.p2 TRINITY_DN1543_c0_g1~~TRINITY_DN1543_c0_g1_i15.p2  ORF type:complete len:338 (+),score=45.26 TRINITY_DN1543_c0_g1_i15:77-1090(+)
MCIRDRYMGRALELLFSLKAIERNGELTEDIGMKLSELPIDPRLGVVLLNSAKPEFNCAEDILMVVSLLSVGNIFYGSREPGQIIKAKKRLGAKEGDHITLINIFIRYTHIKNPIDKRKMCQENGLNEKALVAAVRVKEQLEKMMKKYKLPVKSSDDDPDAIMRCIVTGYFANVAQRQPDSSYKGVRSKETLYLHPSSILTITYPEWVIYNEVVVTGKHYMREASAIQSGWLTELAPHFYEDTKTKMLEQKHAREVEEKIRSEKQYKEKQDTVIKKQKEKQKSTGFAISDMDYYNDSDQILQAMREGCTKYEFRNPASILITCSYEARFLYAKWRFK